MTLDVAGLDDESGRVYLIGVPFSVGEDEYEEMRRILSSAFEEATPILLKRGIESVDKTVFYHELSSDEWAKICDRHGGEE